MPKPRSSVGRGDTGTDGTMAGTVMVTFTGETPPARGASRRSIWMLSCRLTSSAMAFACAPTEFEAVTVMRTVSTGLSALTALLKSETVKGRCKSSITGCKTAGLSTTCVYDFTRCKANCEFWKSVLLPDAEVTATKDVAVASYVAGIARFATTAPSRPRLSMQEMKTHLRRSTRR